MARNIDAWFVIAGAVLLTLGMAMGHMMAASHDHTQMPTHAHLNLLGGVFAILYGLVYRSWPTASAALALTHFWMHLVGALMLVSGLYLLFGGVGESPLTIVLAGVGGLLVMIAMILFIVSFARRALKPLVQH